MSFPIAVYLWSHKGNSQHGQHLNLRSSSVALFQLTRVWIYALFMIIILICILQSKALPQCANTMSPHLKKKSVVSQWMVQFKPLCDIGPPLVWKWYLKGEIKCSPEKNVVRSLVALSKRGLLRQDAGGRRVEEVENERAEPGEKVR